MGAGGRLDPSQVLVTDLSSLQWDRHSLTKFVQAAKRSDKATGKGKGGDRVGACPQGPSTSTSTSPADNSQVCAHEKLGTLVRKKLAKKYGIEGGVPVVTSTEMPRKAFALTPDKAKNKALLWDVVVPPGNVRDARSELGAEQSCVGTGGG
jgi:tRNA A37 threonylcarbamoyladenosine dehydratase